MKYIKKKILLNLPRFLVLCYGLWKGKAHDEYNLTGTENHLL